MNSTSAPGQAKSVDITVALYVTSCTVPLVLTSISLIVPNPDGNSSKSPIHCGSVPSPSTAGLSSTVTSIRNELPPS